MIENGTGGGRHSILLPSASMSMHQQLRRQARDMRRSLTPGVQARNGAAVARRLYTSSWFIRSNTIALYLANDGEVDLKPFAETARRCGKRLFLPALRSNSDRRLWFAEYRADERLIRNRFGIHEPDIRKRTPTPPWAIDLVLMPVVAFDAEGNRLGMGGGFYDRTFAYLERRVHLSKPTLVGIAHECQRIEQIPARSWDIPMHGVVTESRRYLFSGR